VPALCGVAMLNALNHPRRWLISIKIKKDQKSHQSAPVNDFEFPTSAD
jgi:hypothetical protein